MSWTCALLLSDVIVVSLTHSPIVTRSLLLTHHNSLTGQRNRVFLAKQWTQLLLVAGENSTQDHMTDVVFTDRTASTIATVGMDRTLKFFGAA